MNMRHIFIHSSVVGHVGCFHILAVVSSAAVNFSQFSRSVMSDSATPWTAARQASLSITNSRSLRKLTPFEWVLPSNHRILCRPLLLPLSIFPSIRVFSNESVLPIRWTEYWSFSFSIRLEEEGVVGSGRMGGSSSVGDTSCIVAAFALGMLGLK